MANDIQPYTYKDAGFSAFYRRSIGNPERAVTSLKDYARTATQQTRTINFDQQPVSGNLSGVTKVGENIKLDGTRGRISVYDEGDEVVALGDISTDG